MLIISIFHSFSNRTNTEKILFKSAFIELDLKMRAELSKRKFHKNFYQAYSRSKIQKKGHNMTNYVKLNGIHKDQLPWYAISNPVSVGVKLVSLANFVRLDL